MTNRKGLTLVETIIGMTVIAVAFYLLIAVFVTLAPRTARVETLNKKVYLAHEKLEEYLTRDFGQTASVAATALTGSFANYNYQIVVTYVSTSDLNTTITGPSNFKNVRVQVWGGQPDAAAVVEIVSLVTSYEVQQ